MDIQNINRVPAFTTKDGSEIRELLAHRNSCIRNQTLAEARLPATGSTTPHRHLKTEEIYYILEGQGLMQIGEETCPSVPAMRLPSPRAICIRLPTPARMSSNSCAVAPQAMNMRIPSCKKKRSFH